MGLDMYLSAKRYTSQWSSNGLFQTLKPILNQFPGQVEACELSAQAAYWRKVNSVHNWFVKNVQNGEDNCEGHYVTHDQLIELRDLAQRAVDTRDPNLLPPVGGFFFGSTEIDDYYWEDLNDTVAQLDLIISHPQFRDFDYEYRSSW